MRAFTVLILIAAAAAAAYVFGAKAGRSRYREIVHASRTFLNDPLVQKARVRAVKSAKQATKKATKEADRLHRRAVKAMG
ncbi:hypothetical protein SAMN04487846_2910 [Microbacterium sp. cf046]|uniref:hypothetical protein n=1 Tax=Microbacterium sp. cf046 TaxID=1761803 RepID=UPI0008EC9BC8|nr:hypothetical protein [Microbacterium sp. cf046]SFS14382.1 hypothetical protein SAMN04487846_2910 [Microbacterium sp. cf046]